MTIPRIYLPQNLKTNSEIVLNEETSHRVRDVLRLRSEMELIVFNGEGGEFSARILATEKKRAIIFISEWQQGIKESPLSIHLGQGIARGEKMDYIIQKAVELGINSITPLFTEFSNVKLKGDRLTQKIHHWQKISIHAAEQCGRCYIPKIFVAQELSQWVLALPQITSPYLKLTLTPNANKSFNELSSEHISNVIFLVGPEGGLSEKEKELASTHDFISLHLGPRILRTETTALVALSLLQAKYGDL